MESAGKKSNTIGGDGDEPKGKHYLLYWSFVFLGAVFLLPYNAFVSAVDYLTFTFPDRNTEAIMPAINLCVAVLTIFASVALAKVSGTHGRIRLGFVAFVLSMAAVIVDVAVTSGCGTASAYAVVMLANVGVAFAAGVQQASMYGLSSILPIAYSQAVMTGESVAGSIESTTRIVTKFIGDEKLKTSTIVHFSVTLAVLMFGILVHIYVKSHSFVHYYCRLSGNMGTSQSKGSESGQGMCGTRYDTHATSESSTDIAMDGLGENQGAVLTKYKNLAEDERTSRQVNGSFPSMDAGNDGSVIVGSAAMATNESTDGEGKSLIYPEEARSHTPVSTQYQWETIWQKIKDGVKTRWTITRQMWKWALAIFLNQGMTLLMFPGLLVRVPWHSWGDWTPVILIAVFNYCDLIGKGIGPYCSPHLSGGKLLTIVCIRCSLFPLLLMCVLPCSAPYLDPGHSEIALVMSAVIGLTSGIFATIAMSRGPKDVPQRDQELAGMLMVFSCLLGLSVGAFIAVGMADAIPCKKTSCTTASGNETLTPAYAYGNSSSPLTVGSTVTATTSNATTAHYAATSTGLECASTCLNSVIH